MSAVRHGLVALTLLAALPLAGAVTCTVSAVPVAFGVYNPQSASANLSTGSVSVVCLPNPIALQQSYTLSLSAGGAGSFAPRRLAAGANTLQYQLYSDAARTIVWGNGSGGSVTVSGSFTLSVVTSMTAVHTVYGRMPALQSGAFAGTYADTIMVTVTY